MRPDQESHWYFYTSSGGCSITIVLHLFSSSSCDVLKVSFFSGKFPTGRETTQIAPMYKNGARDDCSNNRLIFVLPLLHPAFEKVVYRNASIKYPGRLLDILVF